MIHPVIRIISFLVFAACAASVDARGLAAAALILGLLYLWLGPGHLRQGWHMLRRMRWFFLSILVLYFWFTPGQPALASLPLPTAWLPTRPGLVAGGQRLASLVLIILAVNLLLRTTPPQQLTAAIHWLARPLAWLGLPADRLAVRMVLVTEALATVQSRVRDALARLRGEGGGLRQLGRFSAEIFREIDAAAVSAPGRTLVLRRCAAPPFHQWVYPLALAGMFQFL